MRKDVVIENMSHAIPKQVRYLLKNYAPLVGMSEREALNQILSDFLVKEFKTIGNLNMLKARFEELHHTKYYDDLFTNSAVSIVKEVEVEEDEENDPLVTEAKSNA